jgi:Ca2+-binding RTX toxin-like protein
MAIVRAGAGALRMDVIDYEGTPSFSPTNVRVTYDAGWYTDFGGTYSYSSSGISGTTTTISETRAGRLLYSVTQADADANTLFQLIDSGNYLGAAAYVLRDDDTVSGGQRNDRLLGFGGNDRILGKAGFDTLFGGVGNDQLDGGADGDVLIGGQGRDRLTGGDGSDIFLFAEIGDSTTAKNGRDEILDFDATEGDRIDLSNIDAITGNATSDAFIFVDRFSGAAGEVMVKATTGGFLVVGDTDGIRGADFSIFVAGTLAPVEANFNL